MALNRSLFEKPVCMKYYERLNSLVAWTIYVSTTYRRLQCLLIPSRDDDAPLEIARMGCKSRAFLRVDSGDMHLDFLQTHFE